MEISLALKRTSHVLLGTVISISVLVLAGWQFDIDFLKTPLPSLPSMNPLVAVLLILSAISIILRSRKNQKTFQHTAIFISVVVLVTGLIRLLFVDSANDPAIDLQLYRKAIIDNGPTEKSRMAPNSAFNFVLTSLSILLLHYLTPSKKSISQYISLLIGLLAMFSIIAYLYKVEQQELVMAYVPMAIHTAFAFLLISISILIITADKGFVAALRAPFAGSLTARRLIPAVILLPILLGYLRLQGHWGGVFTVEFGTVLLVFSIVILLLALIWLNTFMLNRRDRQNKKTEAALRDSEKQVQSIFRAAPDAVVVIDSNGLVMQWNQRAEEIFGWTSNEITTHALKDFIIPERYRDAHEQGMKRYLETGEHKVLYKQIEIHAITKQGIEIDVALSISPVLINNKKIFIGFIRDITEQKKVEEVSRENREIFSTIFYHSPVMNVLSDMETGVIIDLNENLAQFYGLEREALIGRTARAAGIEILEPEKRSELIANAAIKRSVRNEDLRVKLPNGEIKWISINVDIIDLNGRKCFLSAIIDVTEQRNITEQIRVSNEMFTTLFYKGPVMNILSEVSSGKILDVNENFIHFFGGTRNEIIGRQSFELMMIDPGYQEELTSMILHHKSVKGHEIKCIVKNGETKWVSANIDVLNLYGKEVFLAALIDITNRKLAEEQVQYLANLIEQSNDAIHSTDENLLIKSWNRGAEQIYGWTAEEVMNKELDSIVQSDYSAVPKEELYQQFLTRGFYTGEFLQHKKNGEKIYVFVSSKRLTDEKGNITGIVTVARDVTEKRMLEDKITEANITLEKKVRQRTSELQVKNKELEQFAYVASHDLQEPLRTTSSFVELLRKRYQGKLDEDADKYISFILQSSDRMKTLIKDLLDYSRIGRKRVLEDVDCNILLKEVLEDISVSLKDTEASITSENLPVLKGYRTELKQLFQNLISNALKFRKKDVPPEIKISAQKQNHEWKFSFIDNGIGIDEQHKDRIFIIFQRLHTRTEYDGSGIGLAHCKKIAELHGGNIWVESTPGIGSTFFVTIHEIV